jgi:hypothetical protein
MQLNHWQIKFFVKVKNPDLNDTPSAMAKLICFTSRLSALDVKPILLGFDGADMSSDAGLILL